MLFSHVYSSKKHEMGARDQKLGWVLGIRMGIRRAEAVPLNPGWIPKLRRGSHLPEFLCLWNGMGNWVGGCVHSGENWQVARPEVKRANGSQSPNELHWQKAVSRPRVILTLTQTRTSLVWPWGKRTWQKLPWLHLYTTSPYWRILTLLSFLPVVEKTKLLAKECLKFPTFSCRWVEWSFYTWFVITVLYRCTRKVFTSFSIPVDAISSE